MKGRRLGKSLAPFCFLALFLATLATANSIFVSQTITAGSIQAILRPVKALIVFLGLYFAITWLSSRHVRALGPRRAYEMLLLAAYLALVAHALIIVLQFAFPSFRDLTYSTLYDSNVLEINKQFRMPGLAGAGGAQLSAVQGLGFLIGVHLALIRREYLPFIMGNLLLIASFVLTGRTGFVMVGISALYLLTVVLFRQTNGNPGRWVRIRISSVLWLSLAVLAAVRFVPPMIRAFQDDKNLTLAIRRTFATYLDYKETGRLNDETLEELGRMYAVPSNVVQLFVGDARQYDNTGGIYYSDIGYVRLLWGYGLIGLIMHLAFYVLMGALIMHHHVRDVMGKPNVAFGMWFLIAIFVLNYKEPFFFARMSYPISLVAIMGLHWLTPKRRNIPAARLPRMRVTRGSLDAEIGRVYPT